MICHFRRASLSIFVFTFNYFVVSDHSLGYKLPLKPQTPQVEDVWVAQEREQVQTAPCRCCCPSLKHNPAGEEESVRSERAAKR